MHAAPMAASATQRFNSKDAEKENPSQEDPLHCAQVCATIPHLPTPAVHLNYGGWEVLKSGLIKDDAASMHIAKGTKASHLQQRVKKPTSLRNNKWEKRNGVLGAVNVGSAGLFTRSATAAQGRLLHGASFYSPTAGRHKYPRSALALTNPAYNRQMHQDPTAPELWTEKCSRNRDELGFVRHNILAYRIYIIKHRTVVVKKHAQAYNTNPSPQIPKGAIRHEDNLNANLESTVPTTSTAATEEDAVEDTFVVGKVSWTDSRPLNASTGSDGIRPNHFQILIKLPRGKQT